MRIGMVAGEASGDLLGAALIDAIRQRHPGARFEGIAGPGMQAAGCRSLYPMERLSVMGLAEVLGRLPELLLQRRRLARHFLDNPPDVFVGVDAPDYNLALERRLKQGGIPCVHYVSPSVWAWRGYRLPRIARSTDHMLALFPFEADYYHQHQVPVTFVGHPLADMIPMEPDLQAARVEIGLPLDGEFVALLPGSRAAEVRLLAGPMVEAAHWLLQRRPGVRFIVSLVNETTGQLFDEALAHVPDLPVHRVEGGGRRVLAAADVALLASGTAALEALLLKRPMVVTYRVKPLTYWIARRLVRVDRYSLPNLLAGHDLIPELIQDQARPEAMGAAVLRYLEDPELARTLQEEARRLHGKLKRDASQRAAEAVLELAGENSVPPSNP